MNTASPAELLRGAKLLQRFGGQPSIVERDLREYFKEPPNSLGEPERAEQSRDPDLVRMLLGLPTPEMIEEIRRGREHHCNFAFARRHLSPKILSLKP
jgi:hypothetical protein